MARRNTRRGDQTRPESSDTTGDTDLTDDTDLTEDAVVDTDDLDEDLEDVDLEDVDEDDEDPEDDEELDDEELDDEDLDDEDLDDDKDPDEDPDDKVAPPAAGRRGPTRPAKSRAHTGPVKHGIAEKLYSGELAFPFLPRRRIFYIVSAVLILASFTAMMVRGFNLGIEFRGGADFQTSVAVTDDTVSKFTDAVAESGVQDLGEVTVRTIGDNRVRIQTRTLDSSTEVPQVQQAIAQAAGVDTAEVAYSLIGATWGGQITQQALIALVVFLALVCVVIAIYFRNWKMSVAAMIALLHDLVVTVGVYAAVGFVVTPASVIGVLTILGYSLYDTVVVFDKVRENTKNIMGQTTSTYAESANHAVNQVLVRSINTTIIAVLPVGALLVAGVFILGEGPLKDLSLSLFVGMIAGAYSSIFIATPLLAQMKQREPEVRKHDRRVAKRRAGTDNPRVKVTDAEDGSDVDPVEGELVTAGTRTRALRESPAGRPQPDRRPRSQRKR